MTTAKTIPSVSVGYARTLLDNQIKRSTEREGNVDLAKLYDYKLAKCIGLVDGER